jgi:hypothetical protein
MKKITYSTPIICCVPLSTESSLMETISQKTQGTPVIDDGTELGAKGSVPFFEYEGQDGKP